MAKAQGWKDGKERYEPSDLLSWLLTKVYDVVKQLVELVASLRIKNQDGDTAYRAAVVGGSNATAQYLKSKGGK